MPTREEVIAELRSRRAPAPVIQEPEATASDGVAGALQGTAQGASWGFGDEILSGLAAGGAYALDKLQLDRLLGGEVDKSLADYYDDASARYSGQVKDVAEKTPGTFLAGNIVGAVATGGALAPTKAATALGNSLRSGGVGARIAKGAAAGATSGAAYGAGSADAGKRLEGAGEGALYGGAFGAAIPAAGAAVRGAIGGAKAAATGAMARGAEQLDESLNAIKDVANAAYGRMRQSGATLRPLAGAQVIDDLTQALKASGPLNKKIHGQTLSVVKDMKALAKKGQLGLEEIDQYRQLFGDLAGDFNNKANARTAGILRDAIDDSLSSLSDDAFSAGSKDALDALKEGRAAFARSRKFETVANIIKKSDGDANYVKRELTKLLNNPKKVRGFNKEERKALAEAAKLGGGEALLKIAGKFGFDTARLGAGAGAIMGSAGGAALGGASGAAIVPAIGTGARYGQKLLTRGKAENLLRVIEQGGQKAVQQSSAPALTSGLVSGNIGGQAAALRSEGRLAAMPRGSLRSLMYDEAGTVPKGVFGTGKPFSEMEPEALSQHFNRLTESVAPLSLQSPPMTRSEARALLLPKDFKPQVVRNLEQGIDIEIRRKGIKEATTGRKAAESIMLLKHLPELIKNGQLVNTLTDKYGRPNIKGVHYFDVPVNLNGAPRLARLVVREIDEGKYVYDAQASGIVGPAAGRSGEASQSRVMADPKDNIAKTAASGNPSREEVLQLLRERRQNQGFDEQSALPPDLAADEGLRLTAYNDTEGFRTVGRGLNLDSGIARNVWKAAGIDVPFDDVYAGKAGITQAQADKLAMQSLKIAMEDASALYKDLPDYSQSRKEALINLSYQMGRPNLAEWTNFNAAVRGGKWTEAARILLKSDYGRKYKNRANGIARKLLRDA